MPTISFALTPESALALYGVLSSFAVPLLTSLIKQNHWSRRRKILLAAALSIVGALATLYGSHQLDNAFDVAGLALLIFTASQPLYDKWLKEWGIEDALNPVEVDAH